ncbi:hypothetical protein D3C81_2166540 [compost metagenome]
MQVRNAVGTGDRDQFDFDAEFLGDQGGNVDVQALRCHVGGDGTERREVLRYGDTQYAFLLDIVECIGTCDIC